MLFWIIYESIPLEKFQVNFGKKTTTNKNRRLSSEVHVSFVVTKSCPTFCGPMDCMQHASLPCPSLQTLLKPIFIELVMPSNRLILSPPSPPVLNLSQHQGLYKWVSSLLQVVKVLEIQLQHQSFHWIFRVDFL